jgi:signal transduction histidine kinase
MDTDDRAEEMYNLTTLALLLTIVVLVGLTAVAWFHRERRGAKIFVVLQVLAAFWAGLTIVGLRTPPGPTRVRIWGATWGLSLLVIVFWLGFILSYTGRDNWITPRRLGVISLPLVFGAGLYFSVPSSTLMVGDISQETIAAGTVVTSSVGPVGALLGIYIYSIFLIGLVLVVKTVVEGSRFFIGQALAFVFGSLFTIVSSLVVVLGLGVEGYPLTQVSLGPQALLWGYAVFGQQFLQIVPAVVEIGERAVFEDLDAGIIVVNDDGIVVRTNPRVKSHLGAPDLTGEPVAPLLDDMKVDTLEDLPARFEYERRTYRADSSDIHDWQGEPVGQAIIIRDISQLVTREQRLAVLNRILRHNVRNDMNIVLGIGEQLQTRSSDELTEYGSTLSRTARKLDRVSEKALEVNRMFEREAATDIVDLPKLISHLVSSLREEYPDATIETSIHVDSIRTDTQILRKVLEEVVANALEHAGDAPAVQIEVDSNGKTVELQVSDDGPGVPQTEMQPLTSGEVSELEHTSSFGLWFVKWGIQTIGGRMDIRSTNSGTEVTLILPE